MRRSGVSSVFASALVAAAVAAVAAAQDPAAPPSPGPPTAAISPPSPAPAPADLTPPEPAASAEATAPVAGEAKARADKEWLAEVCPLEEKAAGETWLDRSQERLGWSVCRATLWFDGLFGDQRAIGERDATYGYLQPGIEWSEHDGVSPELRFRGKINLPVANRRWNALVGRNDGEDRTGQPSSASGDALLPEGFLPEDDEWLVGLGYTPVRGARRRLDFDAGVEISSSPDVFLRGRYRRHWFLSDRDLIRMRPGIFWRSDDGVGTALSIDFERLLRGPFVARWRNHASYAQRSPGVEWFEELTLFQRLGEKTALAYVLGADGATKAEVPVRKYSFAVVYRRNILRDWLFAELRPGVDWRRRQVYLDRRIEPFLGVGVQIHFGDRQFE